MEKLSGINYTMLCDFYELTMGNGYFDCGMGDVISYFDIFYRTTPDDGGFAIAAGLEQAIDYVNNLHFSPEDIAYLRGRGLFREDFLDAFEQCDIVCGPTSPFAAYAIGKMSDDPLQMYLSDIFTISLNLAGLPGLSLPVGLGAESKMPVGLQLIGPAFGETRLLGIGHALERALPGIGRPTL